MEGSSQHRVSQILSLLPEDALQAVLSFLPDETPLSPLRTSESPAENDELDRTAVLEFLSATSTWPEAKAIRPDPTAHRFDFLQSLPMAEIVKLFRDELAQTTAAVLMHLPPDFASRILAGFPMKQRIPLVHAISTMRKTSDFVASELEIVLREQLARNEDDSKLGGVVALRDMLSHTDPSTAIRLSTTIERTDDQLVDKLSIYSDTG